MTQLPLYDNFEKNFFELLTIRYDGHSRELKGHEINARAYATSIGGYAKFLQAIASAAIGKDIEILVITNENGSFKTVVKIAGKAAVGLSVIASLLSWLEIRPHDIKNYVVALQEKIVELIVECDGKTSDIIKKIESNDNLDGDAKGLLIKIIENNKMRKGLDEFTSPLDRIGYDIIEIANTDNKSFEINAGQRNAFKFTPPDVIVEEPFKETVRILYLSPELTEWKFQGTKDFWAEVTDQTFLDRTKDRRFSELQGKYYQVSGTKKTIRKEGAARGTPTWIVDRVTDVEEFHTLLGILL